MMSSGIANTAQGNGVRSFVKAVFSASQKTPNKQKYSQQSNKRKDPTLPQKQILGIGKRIGLYFAAVVNLELLVL